MSITEAIKTCFRKYVDFSGRARRSEYWYWVVFTMIVNTVVAALEKSDSYTLSYLVSAALFLPGLGVAVRRMHDVGKSGWYLLIALIPIVGWILVIVKLATEGDAFTNAYGDDPKGRGTYTAPNYTSYGNAAPQTHNTAPNTYERSNGNAASWTVGNTNTTPRKPNAPSLAFCPNCGTAVKGDARFCPHCGKPVGQ